MYKQGIEEWSVTDHQNRMLLRGRPGHCYPSPVLSIRSLHNSSHLKGSKFSQQGSVLFRKTGDTSVVSLLNNLIYNKQEQNYNKILLSKSFLCRIPTPKKNDDTTTSQIFSVATSCGVVCVCVCGVHASDVELDYFILRFQCIGLDYLGSVLCKTLQRWVPNGTPHTLIKWHVAWQHSQMHPSLFVLYSMSDSHKLIPK